MTSYDDYNRIDAVRWSSLKRMSTSPLHYWHGLTTERPDAAHFRIGTAVHTFVLEPDTFTSRVVCYRDGVRRGKAWEAFKADNEGRLILSVDEYDRALGAGSAVLAHPAAGQHLAAGLREATLTWTDDATGLKCKARVDHCGSSLVDLKTTANLDGRLFAASAVRLGYLGQLAFYLDGLKANGVAVHDEPLLIAVESSKPHDVVPYRFRADVVDYGREEYQTLMVKLKGCMERNEWPGRAQDVVDFQLPNWVLAGDDGLELVIDGESVAI